MTAACVFWILNFFHITVNIRNICVLLAPWFASNTSIAVYILTKEVKNTAAGLTAAALVSIVPGSHHPHIHPYIDSDLISFQVTSLDLWLVLSIMKELLSLLFSSPMPCGSKQSTLDRSFGLRSPPWPTFIWWLLGEDTSLSST